METLKRKIKFVNGDLLKNINGFAPSPERPVDIEAILVELSQQVEVLNKSAIVSVADKCGKIIYVNEMFCKLSQYSEKELIGNNHRMLKSGLQDDCVFENMWKTISIGNTWRGEVVNEAKDGSYYWVDATIVPFKDKTGSIVKYVAVRFDITAQKRQQEELQRQAEAIKISHMKLKEVNMELESKTNRLQASEKVLHKKKDEIQNANVKLKAAYEILNVTNDTLEKHNNMFTDSIRYAKNIQNGLLPKDEVIKAIFPQSFIFHLQRDIVGGDFYWLNIKYGHAIFAVADCTGHGVPGAMLSMIGGNLLNQVVMEMNITDPGTILQELNKRIRSTFSHNNIATDVKDGMEIGICSYNLSNGSLAFAGAGRSLCYISADNDPEIIKGSIYGVGNGYQKNSLYTSHQLKTNKGDSIYMCTDGYTDQFGGEQGKKFGKINFCSLISSMQHLSMVEQGHRIENNFNEWKSGNEQVDDVLVGGIRF